MTTVDHNPFSQSNVSQPQASCPASDVKPKAAHHEVPTQLDEQQNLLVQEKSSLFVLSGPGTGKSIVLTERLRWLVKQQGVKQSDILVLTISDQAAMRICKNIGNLGNGMMINSFVTFCKNLILQTNLDTGLEMNLRSIDRYEQEALIQSLMEKNQCEANLINPELKVNDIRKFIIDSKYQGKRSQNIKSAITNDLKFAYAAYEFHSHCRGFYDDAEFLLRTVELLIHNVWVRRYWKTRFKHILIDAVEEMQPIHYAIVSNIVTPDITVAAFGDDDQALYNTRHDRYGILEKIITNLTYGNVIRLNHNYRSSKSISNLAQAIICQNAFRVANPNFETNFIGEKPRLTQYKSDQQEASAVAEEIKTLHNNGRSYDEVAVLSNHFNRSDLLRTQFRIKKIPYQVQRNIHFATTEEIRSSFDFLLAASNCFDKERLLQALKRLQVLTSSELKEFSYILTMSNGTYLSALLDSGYDIAIHFADTIKRIRDSLKSKNYVEAITEIVNNSGLKQYYTDRYDWGRVNNLNHLLVLANEFNCDNYDQELNEFIEFVRAKKVIIVENSGLVTFSSIYAAKGLEFDCVFLIGVDEDMFPGSLITSQEDMDKVALANRSLYIGVTRARKKLNLSYSLNRSKTKNEKSFELSAHLTKINSSLLDTVIDENPI